MLAQSAPLVATKAFSPASITAGGTSTLTITLDNSASGSDATNVVVIDPFPTGMVVAPSPTGASTCTGGSVSATPGDSGFDYVNGTVTAGTSCQVSVVVTAPAAGTLVNTTFQISSSQGTSANATATLNVTAGTPTPSPSATPVPALPAPLLAMLLAVVAGAGALKLRKRR